MRPLSEQPKTWMLFLLNEDYYKVLLKGRTVIDGLSVLRPEYLILFKAKAYMDLKMKRDAGQMIHSSEFKKHKKDVLRIVVEMNIEKVEKITKNKKLVNTEVKIHGRITHPNIIKLYNFFQVKNYQQKQLFFQGG